ncbi:YraN family protein [Oceanospirillum beijerinckii]|uniref:YraN family protein n=1 Tax=Oceanospirillum beijerinckii TaxID=64976 RepID=UPI0003F946D3|nr:YraN family protein [Oceanospirillum beijerinckii]MAC47964.1 YraN family protein [Oceanospirillum sp.]
MTRTSYQTGMEAEDLALNYLQQQGLQLIARNVRFKGGELDLIMQSGNTRVFIEVRFRKSHYYGGALESITHRKQQRLIRSAMLYNQRFPTHQPWRIDVVCLSPGPSADSPSIEWLQSAISS